MGDTPHTKSLPRLEFGGGYPEPFLKSVLKRLPLSCVCQTLFSGAVYWGQEGVGEGGEFMLSMLACDFLKSAYFLPLQLSGCGNIRSRACKLMYLFLPDCRHPQNSKCDASRFTESLAENGAEAGQREA